MPDCSYCHQELPPGAARCPRCGTAVRASGDEEYERHGTLMEPIRKPTMVESSAERTDTIQESIEPPTEFSPDEAVPYRPVFRAPMGLLTILDDGRRDRGEAIRIRGERTILGRTTGDITIPHDSGVSGTHAEIVREQTDGDFRWLIRDLDSRNGTFVRVSKARLAHNQQILIGAQRFRFSAAQKEETNDTPPPEEEDNATKPWQSVSHDELAKLIPALVELGPEGEGERYLLDKPELIVGSSIRECNITLKDDPFVSGLHCRVFRDDRGRWTIENRDSLNGVWLRIESTPIIGDCEFQLGEQRFSFRVL